jgi:16S rRNA (cytidine1402-2'-O)-methyltransferase
MATGKIYLIPTVLHEDAVNSIPPYVIEQAKLCDAFFVENEKTARRYLKKYWR